MNNQRVEPPSGCKGSKRYRPHDRESDMVVAEDEWHPWWHHPDESNGAGDLQIVGGVNEVCCAEAWDDVERILELVYGDCSWGSTVEYFYTRGRVSELAGGENRRCPTHGDFQASGESRLLIEVRMGRPTEYEPLTKLSTLNFSVTLGGKFRRAQATDFYDAVMHKCSLTSAN